jgi:purine-binding chemotaxis protein CheW
MAEAAVNITPDAFGMTDREGKYLTFALAEEEYGIGILKVKEIIGMMSVTHVPQTPDFVKGVINLRGKVIPVMDLRLKFGMSPLEYNRETCIIVINMSGVVIGIVVDTVAEVLDIHENDIDPAPSFGTAVRTNFILGMGKVKGKVKILLDIEKVLSEQELEAAIAAV